MILESNSGSRVSPNESQLGKEIGWDLIEGNWVGPHGTGKIADLVVRFESDFIDDANRSASATLRFANPGDGIIPINDLEGDASFLKFPRLAPEDGYDLRKLEYSQKIENNALTATPQEMPKGYFLRLRTKTDENGRVKSAVYGKITKPFELLDNVFMGRNYLFLKFDYYLNLTLNDRNMEYDQKNNLAPEADKDLRWPP